MPDAAMPEQPSYETPSAHAGTIAYYDAHGRDYAEETWGLDLTELYRPFEERLPPGGRILDAGSGSGRDTLHFLEAGYDVVAFDASEAMARESTARTGLQTLHLRFDELEFEQEFDGVWACASLLHVPAPAAIEAHTRLARALRPGGVLYASYKYGRREHMEGDRLFTDHDEASVAALTEAVPLIKLEATWLTTDLTERSDIRWTNVVYRAIETDPTIS